LALSDEKTIAELSSEFGVHQTQIHRWVKQVKDSVAGIFSGEIKTEEAKGGKNSIGCTPKSASSPWNAVF